jgi:nucleoside-diphosphate-sugar epimerase
MQKKVLITGGLGHIGSYLIHNWNKNDQIIVIDNLLTQRYCSLFYLPENVRFIEKDVKHISDEDLNGVTHIIHLAAIVDAANSFSDPSTIMSVNCEYTIKLLELSEKCKSLEFFIFPSTTSVYGSGTPKQIFTEDNSTLLNPQSPYAESKVLAERAIMKSSVPFLILRFGTIFGRSIGMRFQTAVNKLCFQAAFNQKLTVWKKNIEYFRPYLGLHDCYNLINGLVSGRQCLKSRSTYNVISCNEKLSNILNIICFYVGKLAIDYVDSPLLNQNNYFVSDEKIREFGFIPGDMLENGIFETLSYLGVNKV